MRPQLLCTFTRTDQIEDCSQDILWLHQGSSVADMQSFLYVDQPEEAICVYSVVNPARYGKSTITINKKKESNTLYSINALNGLIRDLNHGVLDKSFRINWPDFADTLLLADRETGYKTIRIEQLA